MTDQEKKLGCNERTLKKIDQIMNHMADRHNKVLFMRYDIRFPQDYDCQNSNTYFRAFQEAFIKNRKRKGFDPHYLAVRETSEEKHQHYHVALFMDGNKTQRIRKHIDAAEQLWTDTLGLPPRYDDNGKRISYGLIDDCTKHRKGHPQENGVILYRNDPEYDSKFDHCFYRTSYLAKENQKGNAPKRQRELFSSRIPKE